MPESRTASEISEQLFEAIDAIVMERIRTLKYDKTVVATVIENSKAPYGKYQVTTDDNITFYAYADTSKYELQDKVYVRIPEGDYTKQKIITGYYIPSESTLLVKDYRTNNQTKAEFKKIYRFELDKYKLEILSQNDTIKFDKYYNIVDFDTIYQDALDNNPILEALLKVYSNFLKEYKKLNVE